MYKEEFNPSQIMTEKYFEFHHTYTEEPLTVELHQHPFYEIFFFLSGNVNYIIEGRTYNLRPGDILLTGSADIHRPDVRPGKPYERIVVWLADDVFISLKDLFGEDLTSCFTDAALKDYRLIRPDSQKITDLKRICGKISEARKGRELGSAALVYSYMTEFLVKVSRAYYDTPDSIKNDITENEKVNQILLYINENLTEELSLDQLASRFYISKYYLSRQFKQYTGLSLYQYIIKKRLITSRNLLRNGVPVMDACLRCGFSDYSNFLKVFKREFGKNPSEYYRS